MELVFSFGRFGVCGSLGDIGGEVAKEELDDDEDEAELHALEMLLCEALDPVGVGLLARLLDLLPFLLPTRRNTCPPKLTTRIFVVAGSCW